MTEMYRTAIVGTGQSVANHLSAVRALPEDVELVAAVDTDETRVKAVCAEHNIPHWYTSVSAMLAAEHPDIVQIVTPPATHTTLAIECLEAGAWVYCEKPLCASLAEFDRIAEAEQRTGRYVSTVFQWRFGSAAQHVKHLINTQALGRPLLGICHTLWYRNEDYYRVPWRGKWATETGGVSATLGIHLADLFLWLLPEWREVQATAATLDRNIEVEDVALATVQFENGALGSIVNSVLSPRQESYLRLDFQQATIEVKALYRYTNDNWRFTPRDSADSAIADCWQIPNDISSTHHAQLAEILAAMAAGSRPPVSGLEARRIVEFLASLYKSAFTHQPVLRGSITPDDPFYHAMNGIPRTVNLP